MQARRPLVTVLDDPATPTSTREKLRIAQAARRYASEALGLPDNASYTEYAALNRRYVVWNVFAAPPLSLELKESCFLFVGCLSYRGYFSEAAAQAAGAELRAAGYDVFVGGVAAYSTLGWFADPLLSSMLHWENAVLVKTLFHELAHQRLYVANDSTFNESFATAVADVGFARWRTATALGATVASVESHEQEFISLVLRYQQALKRLYASAAAAPDKLAAKQRQFTRLRQEFTALSRHWPDRGDYARWLARDLNNAKLASLDTYHIHVPAFVAILRAMGDNLPRFYRAVEALSEQPRATREACLAALAVTASGVPAPCAGKLGAARGT
jgi:predicted aminopeptidase